MKIIKPIIIVFATLILSCKNSDNKQNILFYTTDFRNEIEKTKSSNSFTLNKDNYLTINFTLKEPLIESLRELSPELSDENLLEKGNFQFSFFVDEKHIYTENLHSGAGTKDSKTTQLEHTIPLIYPEQLDFWSWFMWLKFMKIGGGRDALDTGKHQLSIEVRPYLNNDNLLTGNILSKGTIKVLVNDLPFDTNLETIQDIQPAEGWSISKDYYNQDTIKTLNKKIAQGRFEHINSVVVTKNGSLLIEEYFNDENRESLHDVRSVGKSFASTMIGIAISDGYLKDELQTLNNFYNLKDYSNYSAKKEQVTLKSLLTMSSGFVGDDSDMSSIGNEEYMYPTNNWVKFALDLPMDENKSIGEDYNYFTAGVVVLGDIIHKTVPDGLVNYADNKLFKPLGISNYKWQYTPQNVGNTAGGIQLRAIDFAKYGQLYKNNGNWNGKQILSEAWVKKSLKKHVIQPQEPKGGYGYLFWNKFYNVNGKDYEVSYCTGNGGNKIFIFKDIPFVVVITASGYGLPYMHSDIDKMMTQYILPAVLE